MAAERRVDVTSLLFVAGLVLFAVQVGLLAVLLLWPDPPFDLLPGQQLTDSRAP